MLDAGVPPLKRPLVAKVSDANRSAFFSLNARRIGRRARRSTYRHKPRSRVSTPTPRTLPREAASSRRPLHHTHHNHRTHCTTCTHRTSRPNKPTHRHSLTALHITPLQHHAYPPSVPDRYVEKLPRFNDRPPPVFPPPAGAHRP